jgi:hypothetical protein
MYLLCEGNEDTSFTHINKHTPVRDVDFDEHVTNQLTTDRQRGVSGTGQVQAISRPLSSCIVASVTATDGFTSSCCNQLDMSPATLVIPETRFCLSGCVSFTLLDVKLRRYFGKP